MPSRASRFRGALLGLATGDAVGTTLELKTHPLRPLSAPYTSLSGFAANTDNFFALNDQTGDTDPIDVVIVGPSTKRDGLEGLRVIEAPSDHGVLLVRRVVASAEAFPAIGALPQQVRAELLP